MPSDERARLALAAFKGSIGAFRSSLLTTADEVRGFLATCQSTWDGLVARVAAELGPLAVGRIDPEQFASVVDSKVSVDPAAVHAVQRALETLEGLARRTEELCTVAVPGDGSLYETVTGALGEIGRAFAAARLVHDVRIGKHDPAVTGPKPLGFARWSRAERRLGPPLVVTVQGRDLRAAGLAEFMDGRQRLALVVEGECPPAPLARLVGPGTFVLQTSDDAGLDRLARWDGPGIAALVPDTAARFVHDPSLTGPERLTIQFMPDRAPRRALGGQSAAQLAEELELLRSLAGRPAAVPAGAGVAAAGAGVEPADKLASWLLSQIDLSDVG